MLLPSLIAPILLFIFGYLVRFKKMSFLIAGYNTASKKEKEKYDEEALCKAVGNLLFLLSLINLILPVGLYLFPDKVGALSTIITVLTLITTITAIIYMNTGNRYKNN